jgi:hypothetical protein
LVLNINSPEYFFLNNLGESREIGSIAGAIHKTNCYVYVNTEHACLMLTRYDSTNACIFIGSGRMSLIMVSAGSKFWKSYECLEFVHKKSSAVICDWHHAIEYL